MRYVVTLFVAALSPPYFSTLARKRHDFRKTVFEYKMFILIFSTTLVSNISYSKKNLARYCHKYEKVLMYIIHYSCRILMKLEIS
jgi:hypothetical protein